MQERPARPTQETAQAWAADVRHRLAAALAAWPEEDSTRKARARQLLAGDWGDGAHAQLAAAFLTDHGAAAPRLAAAQASG